MAKRGVDCGHIQSLLRQAHFIQVPIMKPGDRNSLRCERNMWQLGEKRRRLTDRHRNQTPFDQMEFGYKGNGVKKQKRPHTKTHVHAEWNPRELTGSDHNPLPPAPPTQGRTSQRPKWVSQLRPRTTTCTPSPLLQKSPSSLFLSTAFFLCSFSLSMSVAFCLSFF